MKSTSRTTVLIVEDELSARTAIARILRRQGFDPLEAGTVGEALRRLTERPDWLLLDLLLPDGCGSDVLARVKEDHLTTEVCVITGCAGQVLDTVRRMGAKHILIKPVDVNRLISLMRAD